MGNAIEHVTIVGGGTSGWLAAAMMMGGRNRRNDGPDMRVTLIESPTIPTVGVGEATTISIVETLAMLDIDEKDFMKNCNASFKAGVKFVNWDHEPDGGPSWYFHPFEAPPYLYGYQPAYHYHRRARAGAAQRPFAEAMVTLPTLLAANRAPKLADTPDYQGMTAYSYHVDAGLLSGYLKDFCTTLGVEHIQDDVVDAELDERGFVSALALKERGRFPVEFIIDCSGFQGLIIKKTLGEPFVDFSGELPCDRAIALQVPYAADQKMLSYTTSTGLDAGWSWRVPLYNRLGTGYVFSSAHLSDDEAIAELRAHVGPEATDANARAIGMRIGRSQRSWVNNCVAVGLAGGFIEPLESTSIHMVQMGLRWLLDNFPDKSCAEPLRDQYNRLTSFLFEDIKTFILLHYTTSNREDTAFWRAARHDLPQPGALKDLLALWKLKLPTAQDLPNRLSLFSEWNYLYVLYGKRFFDDVDFPVDDAISDDDFDEFTANLEAQRTAMMAMARDHREVVTGIHAAATAPWYRTAGETLPQIYEAAIA